MLQATVHREIERLVESGILLGRMVGQSRMIRVNTHHELCSPLSDLLLATYGSQFFLEPLVAALPEVDQREDGYCMIALDGRRSFERVRRTGQ